MKRMALRFALAAALIGFGWVAGQAQSPQPDFELVIKAPPGGATHIECTRGCTVQPVFGPLARNMPTPPATTYQFGCSGPGVKECSATISGFLKP